MTSERSEQLSPGNSTLFRLGSDRADLSSAHELFSELHYSFDRVTPEHLFDARMTATKVIVFPYVRRLGPILTDKVEQWVAAGGTLVLSYRTADWGNQARPHDEKYFGLLRLVADNPDRVIFRMVNR